MPWLEVVIAFLFWVLSVFLLAVIPVVVALPYLISQWSKFGPPTPEALMEDKQLLFWSVVGIVPAHLLTIAVAWVLITRIRRRPFWKTLGFEWPKHPSPAVISLVCLGLSLVLLAIGWAVTTLLGGGKTQLDLLVESSMGARIATALLATFTAPLVEELVYRGVLYSALEQATGKVIGVILVTMLFAGVHVFQYLNNPGVILVITILSLTLTMARAYTGSLWPPFIIHLIFNGIQSTFIILAPFIEKFQKTEEVAPATPGFDVAFHFVQSIFIHVCRMT